MGDKVTKLQEAEGENGEKKEDSKPDLFKVRHIWSNTSLRVFKIPNSGLELELPFTCASH